MRMLLPMLDKASQYLSSILKNDNLVQLLRKHFPKEFNYLNWSNEILLELFYSLCDWDKMIIQRNMDIALESENQSLEINHR